jgi:hypothetical protein
MEILNTMPLAGYLTQWGAGAANMVMTAVGVNYSKQRGTGVIGMVMAAYGAGTAIRRAQALASMVMAGQGAAPPLVRGQADASMQMRAWYGFPSPKVIAPGFLSFVRDRRMSVSAERRTLVVAPEPRRFTVQQDQRSA